MGKKPYERTSVNYMKSQEEIAELLRKEKIYNYQFTTYDEKSVNVLRFTKNIEYEGTQLPLVVQIETPVPSLSEASTEEERKRRMREWNRMYRVLKWWIKSKFEAINAGLYESYSVGFIKEFYPDLLLKDTAGHSRTLYELLLPQMIEAIEGKRTDIKMLPDLDDDTR